MTSDNIERAKLKMRLKHMLNGSGSSGGCYPIGRMAGGAVKKKGPPKGTVNPGLKLYNDCLRKFRIQNPEVSFRDAQQYVKNDINYKGRRCNTGKSVKPKKLKVVKPKKIKIAIPEKVKVVKHKKVKIAIPENIDIDDDEIEAMIQQIQDEEEGDNVQNVEMPQPVEMPEDYAKYKRFLPPQPVEMPEDYAKYLGTGRHRKVIKKVGRPKKLKGRGVADYGGMLADYGGAIHDFYG